MNSLPPMKILIVCSINSGVVAPFICEQADALVKLGVEVKYFTIEGKGINGYLRNYAQLQKAIKEHNPDLIHAHYGLSGLLANLQRRIPVITTYHGSDIYAFQAFLFSVINMTLTEHNVFVSKNMTRKSLFKRKQSIIPCGVDMDVFYPLNKDVARLKLGYNLAERIILFSGSFQNPVKNSRLAKDATDLIPNARLVELSGYTRSQVALLMNAADLVLMTSVSEGSPQIIKEAMACNCAIVSTDVGDVNWLISNIEGCFISDYESKNIRKLIKEALCFTGAGRTTKGRERLLKLGLDSESIANRIIGVYSKSIERNIQNPMYKSIHKMS